MPNEVVSFTERALLNQTALDILCPPNCEKKKIQTTSTSVLKALVDSRINPFSNKMDKSYLHWGTKPIRAIGRVAYTAVVTTFVAPLGAIWFGSKTVKHLSLYSIAKYQGNELNKKEQWEKVKQYAKPFFDDLTNFLCGAALTSTLVFGGLSFYVLPALVVTKTAWDVFSVAVFGAACIGGASYLLGAFNPEYMTVRLIADEDRRAGMFLALAMRNRLGLVDKNGGLLPFSKEDKIECQKTPTGFNRANYQFKGQVHQRLTTFILQAELELLDATREANQCVQSNGEESLAFSYPFNGNEVAKKVDAVLQKKLRAFSASNSVSTQLANVEQEIGRIRELIGRLQMMQYKVETLKGFHHSIMKMAVEGSTLQLLIEMLASQNRTISMNIPESYLNVETYRQYFQSPYVSSVGSQLVIERERLFNDTPAIDPIDPARQARPQSSDLYNSFKYQVAVAKWLISKGRPVPPLHEMLGLKEEYTFSELRQAFRQYSLVIHPDKNGNTPEATQLFQIFRNIHGKLQDQLNALEV